MMMWDIMLWAFITTATVLVVHEMDSVFWKEWKLFRLPGGVEGFLLLHVPIVAVLFYAAVAIARQNSAGLWLTVVFSGCGIIGFAIHCAFLIKGDRSFHTPFSFGVLGAMFVTSTASLILALWLIIG